MKRPISVDSPNKRQKNEESDFSETELRENEADYIDSSSDEEEHPQQHPRHSLPSSSEIAEINETALLFKSNLFKLQIEELLKSVAPKTDSLNTHLHDLKGLIMNIPSFDESIDMQSLEKKLKSKVKIPFPPLSSFEANGVSNFRFQSPSAIYVIGSFLLKTLIRKPSGITVDLGVEMPKVCLNSTRSILLIPVGHIHRQGHGQLSILFETFVLYVCHCQRASQE